MKIEYEAIFQNIEKDDARKRLKAIGATLVRPEFLQKRMTFDLPQENKGKFIRIRDEGDKITLAFKIISGKTINDFKESMVTVDSFDETVTLITAIGCRPISYEETKRELWKYDGADITIDDWPFLSVIVEVEGKSEEHVKSVSEKLGYNWKYAKFCSAGMLYVEKYGFGPMDLGRKTGKLGRLVFEGENPFL